jgi:hypothetical protein
VTIGISSYLIGVGVLGCGTGNAFSEAFSFMGLKVDAKNSSLDRFMSFWKDFSSGEMEGLVEPSNGPSSKNSSEVG